MVSREGLIFFVQNRTYEIVFPLQQVWDGRVIDDKQIKNKTRILRKTKSKYDFKNKIALGDWEAWTV